MSQADEILALLQRRPNLTARHIAEGLEVDRRTVNSLLYGPLRGKVIQDNSYRWRIAESSNSKSRTPTVPFQTSETPIARLCRYYLDCLSFDEDTSVSLFAASKYDLDYFDPGLPSLEETLANGVNADGIQTLLQRLSRNHKTLVLGYPVRLRLHRARTGRSGYLVEPVMLFSLHGSPQDPANSTFEPLPTVNFAHLRSLGMGGVGDLMREATQLADDLGLAGGTLGLPELDELFSRLQAVRPEWDWQEASDVDSLSSGTKIEDLKADGIYNRAIICGIERSPYTVGLETELESLIRLPRSLSEKQCSKRYASLVECKDANYSTTKSRLL